MMRFNGFMDDTSANTMARLVDDFIDKFGVDVVYLRKNVTGIDHILNEEVQVAYGHGKALRIVFTDTPIEVDSPVIDKFGLDFQFGNYYKATISKMAFNEMFSTEGRTFTEPEAGDLIYVKKARLFLEVAEVSDDPNMFADAGQFAVFQVKLHPWRNNMDEFTEKLVTAFDTPEGFNDLVIYRRANDLMGIAFPDQNGDTTCVDELNHPLPDPAPQVTIEQLPDGDFKTEAEELEEALDEILEDRDNYARNKTFKDEKDFGWS